MKKLLLVLFVTAISVSDVNSQNIDIFNGNGSRSIVGDTITYWHAVSPNVIESDFNHTGFAKIVNKSGGVMTIKLRRIERQIINGSQDYLCWGTSCFGSVNAGSTPVWDVNDQAVVNANDTAGGTGLVVYIQPNDNVGDAIYQYHFYNQDNSSDSASVYVKWSISLLTDINEISAALKAMDVYPNPAKDNFTVDLNTGIQADHQEIIIRDMLGKIVRRENIPSAQETFRFTTEGMQGGIYFVSYAIDGEILKTNKLVVR